MNESNIGSKPPVVDDVAVLDGLARDMVSALDQIIDRLMTVAPAEGIGWEVPLTLQEVRAVKAIPRAESVTMSTLATSMGVSLPTATHLVDRLVTKGLVVRSRPEHDRRLVLVALSERSRAHQRAFFENRVKLTLSILEPLGPTEREQVVKVVGEIARVVQSRVVGQPGRTDSQ
ncbi:MAG TPA: MarR family transcriptional regulator [Bryobacteraceae bacterium]|nr:MarR family transcriptional regulator [Bryobacteraceae bacterium]